MNIGWPEGIFLAMISVSVIVHLVNHGKPLPENSANYNFGNRLAGALLTGILLYWGGFFA